ncbi:MAG: translesion error-prone DNA polymerase V autoproteolytic subunit [Gammaproteobacteria bacterium]|nr:translesion error-prone DNA polymerase V autoproteolytic subunit [Gammaproteobacteria bacterium]
MLFFFTPHWQTAIPLPLVGTRVRAGFPSPADDYIEERLDLNEHLVAHPNATFYVRVAGESMHNAGIQDGDTLVVDRSLEARNDDIVVAALNGEFTVKRLVYRASQPWLIPCNPVFPEIRLTEDMDTVIWGVVTSVIHKFR